MNDRPVESDELRRFDYLAQHGQKLIDNGYHIVPIRFGGKSPGFDGWEKSRASSSQLKEWLEGGHKNAGVGILTKHTPAIDIDCRDEKVAMLMDTYCREKLGGTLLRIGLAPKRLFLFRCDQPFRKMRTSVRMDNEMEKNQVEVLGEGQQFVAYAKHPDTGKPYYWPDDGANPLEVRASELPTLTIEQIDGLLAYFEEVCDDLKLTLVKAARSNAKALDRNNPFAEDTHPVDMPDDEIRSRLMLVPGNDDHDTWYQVGMALYHQWDGDDIGKEMWHEWSEPAHNYDRDALDERWKSFGIAGKKRAPVTARYILKLSAEAVLNTAQELGVSLRMLFTSATTVVDWDKAAKETKEAEIDALTRSSIAEVAREARNRITGTKNSLIQIKKAIAYSPATKGKETPGWAKPWVYDTSDDKFFNKKSKHMATQQGFNAMYDREAMTKKDILDGNSSPSSNASALALNFYKIRTVNGRRYEPGQDDIFHAADGVFANTYAEHEIPEEPEKKLPRDVKNVARVKAHINHLLTDPREQRMFLDWLAWIVQNPGRHANYSILLQGVEGDGKSFFAEMMRAVMGVSNVSMLNAHIFESDFTDWAVGQCLNCVEEVRLIKAQNKYEVINRIKPYITNNIIEVHPKGKPVQTGVKNTTSYLLFTNFKDALPLDDDGRRFCVLFSQWQRKHQIDSFKDENPDYYTELYATIEESAGAIRQWLMQHEFSDEFKPLGDAPWTAAKGYMIKQAKPEFIQQLDEIVAEDESLFADKHLVDITNLPEVFAARGVEFPTPKALGAMLQRAGYEDLGRVRLSAEARAYFWSKSPEMFRSAENGQAWHTDAQKIRQHRETRFKWIEDKL